jgi:hypothetical protein
MPFLTVGGVEWNVSLGYVVVLRRRGLELYTGDHHGVTVDPGQWLAQPAEVDHGEDWAVYGDLAQRQGWPWVMGTNGVTVTGPGLVVGVGPAGDLLMLTKEQTERIQVWRRSGGLRHLFVR